MEEKKTGRSAVWGAITAATIILLVATIILSVTCVRQRNSLRQKSFLTLTLAYGFMQDVYDGENAGDHPEAFKALVGLRNLPENLDDASMRVKDLVELAALCHTESDYSAVAQIIQSVEVTFDAENNTVSTDMEKLDQAIAQLEKIAST